MECCFPRYEALYRIRKKRMYILGDIISTVSSGTVSTPNCPYSSRNVSLFKCLSRMAHALSSEFVIIASTKLCTEYDTPAFRGDEGLKCSITFWSVCGIVNCS